MTRIEGQLKVLDLFSGIGGFSLGLERTGGFQTVAFCEIDPFCRRVLAKHWKDVPIYDDIRTLTGTRLAADGIAVDVICGGFPCQDVSFAGKRAGLEGARSGLWREYGRIIGEVRPRFVIVENVPGLLNLGMGTVLGDLSALGYDAVWDCIPASAVGAPHRRDRVWIIAYADCQGQHYGPIHAEMGGSSEFMAHTEGERLGETGELQSVRSENGTGGSGSPLAYAAGVGPSKYEEPRSDNRKETSARALVGCRSGEALAHTDNNKQHGRRGPVQVGREQSTGEAQDDGDAIGIEWIVEPDVGRVAHGVPSRVDRLRALGNAVVPQIPEMIGLVILEAMT